MRKTAPDIAPFIYAGNTSDFIYTSKNLALGVLILLGWYQFGVYAVVNTLIVASIVFCSDSILYYVAKKRLFWKRSICSALLIVACIPPATPLVLIIPVTIVVYLVVQWTALHEHREICNPALAVLVFLYAFFPAMLREAYITPMFWGVDVQTSATPLSPLYLTAQASEVLGAFPGWITAAIEWMQGGLDRISFVVVPPQVLIHLIGLNAGTIAEQFSIVILLISVFFFSYSCIRITPIISAITGFTLCIYFSAGFSGGTFLLDGDILHHLFNGGFLFALFFFVGDFNINSENILGNILFGALFGVLAALFRLYSIYNDGTVFALFLVTLLIPLWDQLELTLRRRKAHRFIERRKTSS